MLARIVVLALLGACGPAMHPARVGWPDAQLELLDETDRDQATDLMWATPAGPQRDAQRTPIAAAIARRIGDALEDDKPIVASALMTQLVTLWQREPTAAARGLAPYARLFHQLHESFGKSGSLAPAVQALAVLAEIEPDRRDAHVAELTDVLAFADELAAAENGPMALRAQPIEILEPVATALPLPWLVDRYVALLKERQAAVAAQLGAQGASMQIVRAHHEILATARRIASVLARADRLAEIHGQLAPMKGIGTDRELAIRAEILADQPTANAYLELAAALRTDEHSPDPTAALATCLAGLAKFPRDQGLLAAAADDAHLLGHTEESIALYERAFADPDEPSDARALRLGKAYAERISRLGFGGRPTAAMAAWHAVERYVRIRHAEVWDQVAALAEGALGRGLMSQGLLREAEGALKASIELAPSVDAFEALATLMLQTDRYGEARSWDERGRALLGDAGAGDRYHRSRLERLAGDVERRAGGREAQRYYVASLASWASLGEDKDLPRAIAAERGLDSGRSIWWLRGAAPERPGQAVDAMLRAVEAEPTATITSGAVAFLLEIGRYGDALDAFHEGLGSLDVDELYKVYMSLWVIGDARRRGEPGDRLAHDYLASRHGDVWYEQLAEAATGRLELPVLRSAATTAPRRAELAFYSATLGLDPTMTPKARRALLEQMRASHLVLDAEYDLARAYLAEPAQVRDR